MKSINVVIDDVPKLKVPDVDADVGTSVQETNAPIQMNEYEPEKEEIIEAEEHQMSSTKGLSIRIQKNHPQDLIIGILIKESQREDQLESLPTPVLCPRLNQRMSKKP